MSAVILFWETNMAVVTSYQYALYLGRDDTVQFWESVFVKVRLLRYGSTFVVLTL